MFKRWTAAMALATALTAIGVPAHAQHWEGPSERMARLPFTAVLRPDQKSQLYAMLKADGAKIEAIHRRLHAAREALIAKLLAPGPTVDIGKEVAELKAAQAAMIDERVSIALAARKLMSPEQLKAAAEFHAKLEELHRQESDLLRRMGSGTGSGGGAAQAVPDAGK
jgi:hypothetical protein